jgi:predicted XRE-type DNA-binding protein
MISQKPSVLARLKNFFADKSSGLNDNPYFADNTMSIKQYSLQEIKKELAQLSDKQAAELCLRMARYKKENKELLAYLLFDADDELAFAESFKHDIGLAMSQVPSQSYVATKALRKTLKLINKYIKFTGSKQVEVELLLSFCKNYVEYVDRRTSHKPLRLILVKQLEKIKKAIAKLHEDLQFDYTQEFDTLVDDAVARLPWLYKHDLLL